jgi:deoxyribonuclease IV
MLLAWGGIKIRRSEHFVRGVSFVCCTLACRYGLEVGTPQAIALMFGSHLSIAGSMCNAVNEAVSLGLDTVQVFTKNQQQWKAKPLEESVVLEWSRAIKGAGFEGRVVSHASYLINLASCKPDLWEKSVDLMTDEIERCAALKIPYLVHHPGSHVGWTLEEGIARIIEAYIEIFRRTKGVTVVSCLEGTVGAGSTIGGPFEHLRDLRVGIVEKTGLSQRVGFCLDSCHLHAAGHDVSSRSNAEGVLERFDSLCGLSNVKVWHLNDSKGAVASKLDRHEHIGQGWVGGGASKHTGVGEYSKAKLHKSGFAAIVNHPAFAAVPKIMETPKGLNEKGEQWDSVNLKRLRGLMST